MKKTVLILLFLMSSSEVSVAQNSIEDSSENLTVFGYVANIPEMPVGFNLLWIRNNGIGFYLDLKFTIKGGLGGRRGGDDFYDNISVYKAENIFGDKLIGESKGWFSLNMGLTELVSQKMAVYGGIGISTWSHSKQYYDEFEILGRYGKYWIPADSKSSLNLNGGLLFLIAKKITINFGGDLKPAGLNIGVGFSVGSLI
jgi:hypothetical protein